MARIRVNPITLLNASLEIGAHCVKLLAVSTALKAALPLARTYPENSFGPRVRPLINASIAVAIKMHEFMKNLTEWLKNISKRFKNADETASTYFSEEYQESVFGKILDIIEKEEREKSKENLDKNKEGESVFGELLMKNAFGLIEPVLEPADPTGKTCVEYAKERRPDLGTTACNNAKYPEKAAANYICKFESTVFQVKEDEPDLREKIAKGYAIVWPPDVNGSDKTFGHVAIVEEVGKDYVIVSQASWGGSDRIPISKLRDLFIIP